MDASGEVYEKRIRSAACRLKGQARRLFQAEVADTLCSGSPRAAERRFGWGRNAVAPAQHEGRSGLRCVEDFAARARPKAEVQDPQLAQDVRAVVEPATQADPEVKSARRYLDNGSKNSGIRSQWIRRMIEFSDFSGLEIRLVYYP